MSSVIKYREKSKLYETVENCVHFVVGKNIPFVPLSVL